ncbi:MAG: hypothetical protein ACK5O7_02140 [Holosporales bacterium]
MIFKGFSFGSRSPAPSFYGAIIAAVTSFFIANKAISTSMEDTFEVVGFDPYAEALEQQKGRIAGTPHLLRVAEQRAKLYKILWQDAHRFAVKTDLKSAMDNAWFRGIEDDYRRHCRMWNNRLFNLRMTHPEIPMPVDAEYEDPYTTAVIKGRQLTWNTVVVNGCIEELSLLEHSIAFLQELAATQAYKGKLKRAMNSMLSEQVQRQLFWRERLKRATLGSILFKEAGSQQQKFDALVSNTKDLTVHKVLKKQLTVVKRPRSASLSHEGPKQKKVSAGSKVTTPR